MFPIIFIVILSIFVFRTARDNGYNAALWTVLTAVGFFVIQFGVGLVVGICLGVGSAFWGWSPTLYNDYSLIISFVALVPSGIFVWLIWRHVNVIRDDGIAPEPPPPPPTFDQSE